jgi:hypothetical protein
MVRVASVVAMMSVVAVVSGCAAIEAEEIRETEEMLVAAGFKMQAADTPKKLANLQTLTQHKIVRHQLDGKLQFIYADAKVTNCIYVGDEAAYQRLQDLQVEQTMVEDNPSEPMDWGLWDRPSW